MVVKRITTFFLKRYLFRVFYFFWRGGAGKSEPDSISTPLWLPQNLYNILFLGRIRKRRRCNLLLTSTLDLKNQAVNEGMQPWRRYRWSVISINLLLTCLGDEQRSQKHDNFSIWNDEQISSNDRENGWYPSNGTLNNQPHVHLIWRAFIGSQSHFKDMRKHEFFIFRPHSCGFVHPRHATIFNLKIFSCPITRAVPKTSDCLLTVEESSMFLQGFKQMPSD